MKCKDCKFYTGIQCHGHGDYWGHCTINYDKNDLWNNVCYDNTECKCEDKRINKDLMFNKDINRLLYDMYLTLKDLFEYEEL